MVPLSHGTAERLRALFGRDREEAARLLEVDCAENLPWTDASPGGLERVRFAVIKLSRGELERLQEAIELAKTDWRDALVAAGFADDVNEHLRWYPGRNPG